MVPDSQKLKVSSLNSQQSAREMIAEEIKSQLRLDAVHQHHRVSAKNLLHYLVLRTARSAAITVSAGKAGTFVARESRIKCSGDSRCGPEGPPSDGRETRGSRSHAKLQSAIFRLANDCSRSTPKLCSAPPVRDAESGLWSPCQAKRRLTMPLSTAFCSRA